MVSMTSLLKDDLDRRLIALLQSNARESTTNIAKKLGVARTTVHERIARLERDGLITGYSVVLSQNPAIERVQALVMLAVRQQQSRQVVDRLRSFPEVKTCLTVNGEYDLFLIVETPRLEDLDVVLDEIAEIPGIERTASSIVLASKFDRRFKEVAQQLAEQLGDA